MHSCLRALLQAVGHWQQACTCRSQMAACLPPSPSARRRKVTHPEFGTEMRMLLQEVPVRIAVEGDKTWSGLLGPLRDP